MKILTWNVERLQKNKNEEISTKLYEFGADIIVLTETSSILNLGDNYKCISTETLTENYDNVNYKMGENRTSIWTKYNFANQYKTFDNYTSICSEIETEFGLLKVYATIIGIFGGIGKRFESDLIGQLEDFNNFEVNKLNCIIGDLNVYFSGYAYPSHYARNILNETFEKLKMVNLTSEITENVDHIIISKEFIKNKKIEIETWNIDKKLSDHIGICAKITK
ncbi:endonuclease/exonuclease/phosphatase family protein [Flavobacterium psychrophilum]|uniref:endonuclease/exonuclease/phosphatase family protein n=1 Tax=Flavobacterium psychrophilum TaxID=96345 RepID=UPI00061876A7|nr:endonuclease/exonuclease/phosphatase family protein [Flavobacterium psychrophilum]OAE90408.1 hypothetical protein SU65_11755 [Flavobacterium psychrophilum]